MSYGWNMCPSGYCFAWKGSVRAVFKEGRVLDRLYEVGTSKVVSAVALRVVKLFDLDTTTFTTTPRLAVCMGSKTCMEKNFGFLKDPIIVNALFLKSRRRIEALGLILVLALVIWRLMERTMGASLKDSSTKVVGWNNKQTTPVPPLS